MQQPDRLRLTLIACLMAGPALAQQPSSTGNSGVPVTVAKPSRRDVPVYLQGLGLVAANKTVVLHPRVDGTLDKILFNEGDQVKGGTLLAQLDPRLYQAALDQAAAKKATDEANLANARQNLGRSSQLARNQFETQATVDANTAAVAQLTATIRGDDATIQAAKLNLEFTQITAPFDGRVGLRLIDPGNFIRSADTTSPGIVMLSQIQPINVTFTLPQDDLPAIASAMSQGRPIVDAATANGTVSLAEGEVVTIDNSIDTTTGTIKVKATFSNKDNKLWPGQFVNASVLIDTRKNVLTVPSGAVQHGPNGLFIYVVQSNQTVKPVTVTILQDTGSFAVVGSGIADGDTVVTAGQSRLNDGARVTPAAAPAT